MYRIGCIVFFVLTIVTGAIAQNSDNGESSILREFLQQIENQCTDPKQCNFTDEEIEQILKDCKATTQNFNSTAYSNLKLCQKYDLSDAAVDTLLDQYITFLEKNQGTRYEFSTSET